ncbi:hypothetical protein HT094_02290 [Shewanella sp. ZOR0012]|uniref:hypothetical protein n=1 Tax=Shewanella sp. ZOR0012 TaxID=1339231 RepID=UPI0012DFE9A9|nr:hypothetical protein [Shewanella sp. ZOR0012]NSM23267.1 hypothetical protein [Shewanella sp. ZOR0012]
MGRRYRRRRNASQIISDSVVIGSRLPWYGALLFSLISFLIFYYVVPHWFESRLAAEAGSRVYPAVEMMYSRGIRLFHYLGIVTGAVGLFFCVRNYFLMGTLERRHRGIVALLARMLGHYWD